MRSKAILFAAIAAAALVFSGPASATLAELLGDWKNVDAKTRNIVRLEIANIGEATEVHAWGACVPNPCDWGAVNATPYAPNVSAPLPADAQYLQAEFVTGFSVVTLVIGPSPAPGGELRTIALRRFTDDSRRSAYAFADAFMKFGLAGDSESWKERPYDPPVGSRWALESEVHKTTTAPNAVTTSTTLTRAELTIEAKTAAGFEASYVVTDISIDGDAPQVRLMQPILPTLKGFVVHAELDASGKPVSVDNLEEARTHVNAFIEGMTKNFESQPKLAELLRSILDNLLRVEGANAARLFMPEVAKLAQGQNIGVTPGEARTETSETPYPLGNGDPVKTSSLMRIDTAEAKSGDVTYLREGRIDPDSAKQLALAMARKAQEAGQGPSNVDELLKAMTIEMCDRATIRVEGGIARAFRENMTTITSIKGLKVTKAQVTAIDLRPAP